MANKGDPPIIEKNANPAPGDGIRSLKSTMLFRAVNYELYVKPVIKR